MTMRKAFTKIMVLSAVLLVFSFGARASGSKYLNTRNTQEIYGTALLRAEGDSMVPFKAGPSEDAPTTASYFPGLEVQCITDPNLDWVKVRFRDQEAYVHKENLLFGQAFEEGAPFLPEMVVANRSKGAWLNLRERPSLESPALGKYADGQLVTVYGIMKGGEWAHVSTADGKQGFMVPFYLWNHSPLIQHFVSERMYSLEQPMGQGVKARVAVGENFAAETFYTEVLLTFDSPYTTNDDIVGFNLYTNDALAAQLKPVPDAAKPDAAPTLFAAAFPNHDAIDKVHLAPVLEKGGENMEETLLIYKRQNMKETMP